MKQSESMQKLRQVPGVRDCCAEFSLRLMDSILKPSRDGKLHVYLENGEDKSPYLAETFENGHYSLRYLDDPGCALIAEIPEGWKTVRAETTCGDLQMQGLRVEELNLQTTCGDLDCGQIEAEIFRVKAESGDLRVQDLRVEELCLQTTSGNLDCGQIEAEIVRVKTRSGDLSAENISTGGMTAESTSGDMDFRQISAKILQTSTSSGDLKLTGCCLENCSIGSAGGDIRGSMEAVNVIAESTSGDISLQMDRGSRRLLAKGKTKSGDLDIRSDISEAEHPDPGTLIRVYASTASGDITIY